MKTTGTRKEVMNREAKKTSGGLTRKDLKVNKQNKIVSKKKSELAKREDRLGRNECQIEQKNTCTIL